MIDKEGFQFDLETQRFIKNRWETKLGQKVRQKIIKGITSSSDIRGLLDGYALEEASADPYAHPIYSKDAMKENDFWVLTHDDLRGICFSGEDFSNSYSLEKKSLNYSYFHNCTLKNISLGGTDLSYANIEKCNLKHTNLSSGVGLSTRFIDCDLQNTLMYDRKLIDCDFSGSNLKGAFWGNARLENIKVNYLTKFDYRLSDKWKEMEMPKKQIPDILRAIRIAYEKAELWDEADKYLLEEKTTYRKYILRENYKKEKTFSSWSKWFKSYFIGVFSGYVTKPMRIIYSGVLIAFIFGVVYASQGTLSSCGSKVVEVKGFLDSFWESIYFSLTTFATLGYGDLSFSDSHPIIRIMSTSEAWIGAITMALFVTTLARKVFR